MSRILSKDHMHLYQHSTRCSSAVQMFVDENPIYWRFVLMTDNEANEMHQQITTSSVDVKPSDMRDDETVKLFIPLKPNVPSKGHLN